MTENTLTDDGLIELAKEAYFDCDDDSGTLIQPNGDPEITEHEGETYAVFFNVNGLIAAFRVEASEGTPRMELLEEENVPEALVERFA